MKEPSAKAIKENKVDSLVGVLRQMESAVLAYSGGVDSTLILKALSLSGIKCLAVTSASETTPEWDMKDTLHYAPAFGIEHRVIKTEELKNEDFAKNSKRRCFYCKNELFARLKSIAMAGGYKFVLDGSALNDLDDYRPGMEAKNAHGVRSPLIEAGFSKADVREALKSLGVPIWDKPSSPCLSSRIPYGTRVTKGALKQIASAEGHLRSIGFGELRVRHFGREARLELSPGDMTKALEMRNYITESLKAIGYEVVTLDLEGFRSGKMNDDFINPGRVTHENIH